MHFRILLISILASSLVLASSPAKADLNKAPIIAKSGNWSVRRGTDLMTDKKSCVALYQQRFDIQVNEGDFWFDVRGKGGVQGFTYRIDDEASSKMQIPTEIEKNIGAAHIEGSEFAHLLSAKRLRMQVLTILDSLIEADIDLKGLSEMHRTLSGPECR